MNLLTAALLLLAAGLFQGCDPSWELQSPKSTPTTVAASGVEVRTQVNGLGVHGYNYTDTAIYYFSVGVSGGMNLEVSEQGDSGSGTVCCASVSPILIPYKMTVQWTRDGEKWCELEATLTGPIPAKPEYLNVHFYQDGHIELSVSEGSENRFPRLERFTYARRYKDGNVVNDEKFARCQIGRP
ncbi:DUF3304 domain-containing protein [uncultured Deefgea sp.]|uniref:DUF3304 domain-containing protein n=1 Tax=uncultured Deefgea sp. TaxID=1304914 RepID=UPI00262EDB8D|nr:DUF3304 domain-containing protein [uncultured Deefgea sp.]